MADKTIREIAKTLIDCGLVKAAKGDPASPWAVGPAILIARAVFNALREPTPRMLAFGHGQIAASQVEGHPLLAANVYTAMIGAALQEDQG